jgi:hypothetical protein
MIATNMESKRRVSRLRCDRGPRNLRKLHAYQYETSARASSSTVGVPWEVWPRMSIANFSQVNSLSRVALRGYALIRVLSDRLTSTRYGNEKAISVSAQWLANSMPVLYSGFEGSETRLMTSPSATSRRDSARDNDQFHQPSSSTPTIFHCRILHSGRCSDVQASLHLC